MCFKMYPSKSGITVYYQQIFRADTFDYADVPDDYNTRYQHSCRYSTQQNYINLVKNEY